MQQKRKKRSELALRKNHSKTQQPDSIQIVKKNSEPSKSELDSDSRLYEIRLPVLNIARVHNDIMAEAARNPEMQGNLRSMISSCSRALTQKGSLFKRKWAQLRNSHCSQEEYFKKERELRKLQTEQMNEVREDTISKLGYYKIKGFDAKDVILESTRESLISRDRSLAALNFQINEESMNKRLQSQFLLLEKLLKEQDLVSQANLPNKINRLNHYLSEQKSELDETNFLNEFKFTKHFSEIDYDKIFESEQFFKLKDSDIYRYNKSIKSKLIDSKSDQIYYNQSFQEQKYVKYSGLLKVILNNAEELNCLTHEIVEELLQIATYVLNSVHYYQKFKLSCELLHPLDLIYVIDRLKKLVTDK